MVINANEQEQEIGIPVATSAIEDQTDNIVGPTDTDNHESSRHIEVGAVDEGNPQLTSPTSTEDEYVSATSGEDITGSSAEFQYCDQRHVSYNSEHDDFGVDLSSNAQMIAIDIRVVQKRQEDLERYQKLSSYLQGALAKREEELDEVKADLNHTKQRCSALEAGSHNANAQWQQMDQMFSITKQALPQELEQADVDESVVDDAEEKQLLESELETQRKLCAGLRDSLVEREAELEDVKTQLNANKHQHEMLVADSDETSCELRKVQKDLASTQQLLAQEQAKVAHAQQKFQQAPQSAPGVNVEEIIAANHQAQANYQYVVGMLNEVVRERDDLGRQLQDSQHIATQRKQELVKQIENSNRVNDHLRTNVEGMQGQINDLVRQKEAADERVKQVEEYNDNLLDEYANKFVEDPQEWSSPMMCQPNEVRDLRQALETSMGELEKSDSTNRELCDAMKEKTQQISRLRAEKDILREQLARSAANFETCNAKVENLMETLPLLVKQWVGMDVEEFEDLEKNLQDSKLHESKGIEALKEAATKVSETETRLEALKRQHTAEFEVLNKQLGELRAENIQLDGDYMQCTRRLTEKEQEVDTLKADVAQALELQREWRAQCETQAFGDNAVVLENLYRNRVNSSNSKIEALQFKNSELRNAVKHANYDLDMNKRWAVGKLAGIREQQYLLDWYQKQVEMLRERFHEELRIKPLDVPFKPDFYDLPEETKQQIRKDESDCIKHLTGWELELGLMSGAQPRKRDATEIWTEIMADGDDGMSPDRAIPAHLLSS